MLAYVLFAVFSFTAVLVTLSLVDSAMRARLAFRRLRFQRRQTHAFATDVVVTVTRPRIETEPTVVRLPARKPAAAIRALRPLAAAA